MSYPLGVWVQNPSGYPSGSVMYSGPVLFPAGTDTSTQVGVAIFGPNGATTNFPAVEAGVSGLPPIINVSYVQLAHGTSLPAPNPASTLVSPGGPGIAAVYDWVIYGNVGADGATSAFALHNATDLAGTAAIGMVPTVSGIGPTAFTLKTPPAVKWFTVGSVGATASNVNTIKNITSVSIPDQPTDGWLEIYAQALTIGAVDTQVNLVARIGNYSTGTIISTGLGQAGASPAPTVLQPQGLSASTGIITAGSGPTTVFLNGENQTPSANSWNIAAGTLFSVKFQPTS